MANRGTFELGSQHIGNRLKKRYLLAMSIILFLVILSQILIQVSIYGQQDDSRVINIAGRQRMLSQRINKAALGLYMSGLEGDETQKLRYTKELDIATNLWVRSHKGLQGGDEELGLPGKNSDKIISMFSEIEKEHQEIAAAAFTILDLTANDNYSLEAIKSSLQVIQQHEAIFLKGMDAIVFQYDAEALKEIQNFKRIEIAVMIITILTLGMEVLFIFRPIKETIESTLDELEISKNNLEKLFETAPTALFLLNASDLRIKKINQQAYEILHITEQQALNIDFSNLMINNHKDIKEMLDHLVLGISIENEEVVMQTSEEMSLVVLLSSNLITYDDQQTILMGISDITRLKEAEEVLKRYATIDDMTGFLNKRSGMLVLSNAFDRIAKTELESISVCFMDIDGLKSVNDTYGHEEGDLCIKKISQVIKSSVNARDTIFRYGGDEIVLVLNNCNRLGADAVANRIMSNLEKASEESDRPYSYHLSIGIAVHSNKPHGEEGTFEVFDSPEALLTAADHEMYEVKRRYKETI